MRPIIFYILLSLFTLAMAKDIDIKLEVDRTGWVDPLDPLVQSAVPARSHLLAGGQSSPSTELLCANGDGQAVRALAEENNRLRDQLRSLQLYRANTVDTLLKHVLRQFLTKMNIPLADQSEHIFKKAQVSLSPEELFVVKRYLESEKAVEEIALREHLRTALENFIVETDVRSQNSLLSFLHSLLPHLLLLNVVLLVPASVLLLRSIYSVRQLVLMAALSAFCLSCYFTYTRKYQEILAQRFERSEKLTNSAAGRNACSPRGLVSEAFDLLLSYVTIKDKSECLKSYEDMLIEPVWLVDPLQVVAEVLASLVLTPLSTSGAHLNKFFNDFFINTPIHLALVKTLFLFLMPLMVLYIWLKVRDHRQLQIRPTRHQIKQITAEERSRVTLRRRQRDRAEGGHEHGDDELSLTVTDSDEGGSGLHEEGRR